MDQIHFERRKLKRYIVKATALVTLAEENLKHHFSCFTQDISSKGAYLVTGQTFKPGTQLRIRFKIPIYLNKSSKKIVSDQAPITTGLETKATVIWSSDNGMGVVFKNMCRIVQAA